MGKTSAVAMEQLKVLVFTGVRTDWPTRRPR